jgi:hypothetical protein
VVINPLPHPPYHGLVALQSKRVLTIVDHSSINPCRISAAVQQCIYGTQVRLQQYICIYGTQVRLQQYMCIYGTQVRLQQYICIYGTQVRLQQYMCIYGTQVRLQQCQGAQGARRSVPLLGTGN